MSEHLLFCSDAARRNESGDRLVRLEGWCVATSPIQALLLENRAGEYRVVPYGFSRPDVGSAFSECADAETSGLQFSGDIESPANLVVQLQNGDWHRVAVDFDNRQIQKIELNYATRFSAPNGTLSDALDLEQRVRRSLDERRGLTLRLDIINKCNLRCVMCHFSDDAIFKRPTSQLSGEQFKKLFDDVGPFVSNVILSCGDEPLISKFLPEILRYLAAQHPHVAIEFCTNAMLMRASTRNLIMETGVARLMFSIDAVSKPLLESIRVGARYEQLLGNIIALRDLKTRLGSELPTFVFNFVMMNRNIHEAPAFVHMATALGAESIDFRHVVPIGTYFEPDELLIEHPAKYNFYREKIVAEAATAGIEYYLPPPLATADRWQPGDEPAVDLREFESVAADPAGAVLPIGASTQKRPRVEGSVAEEFSTTFCNRPFSEIMIRDQDEVLPCPWHGKTLGRLSEGKTLREIFLGEEFAALRRNMLRPEGDPDCARCPIKTEHLPINANS